MDKTLGMHYTSFFADYYVYIFKQSLFRCSFKNCTFVNRISDQLRLTFIDMITNRNEFWSFRLTLCGLGL